MKSSQTNGLFYMESNNLAKLLNVSLDNIVSIQNTIMLNYLNILLIQDSKINNISVNLFSSIIYSIATNYLKISSTSFQKVVNKQDKTLFQFN